MTPTMNNDLETVAAFIDGERVDTAALKRALSTDEGRDYLVELVAMREVVLDDPVSVNGLHTAALPRVPRGWWFVSAATVVLAVAGGFVLGAWRAPLSDMTVVQAAPAPTKVLKLETGVNWNESQSMKGGQ